MKEEIKIAAGGKIICNKKEGVIGAVIKHHQKICVLTAYHILKVGKCDLGNIVYLNGYHGKIIEIIWDHDLAVIEIITPKSNINLSKISEPIIGPAYSLNGAKRIKCNIMTLGKTYHYLSFPFSDLPLPGDSGSPIIQDGKVVGILASIFYNNATGIAVSIEMFRCTTKN
jgi:hypothetical protein